MKKSKKIDITTVVMILMTSIMAITPLARFFTEGFDETYNTYINANQSFTADYYTLENPTMEYRYKNLKCSNTAAELSVTLYAFRNHWYDFFGPSKDTVGTSSCIGMNKTTGYWYGLTYHDIECVRYSEVCDDLVDGNLKYRYDISNNDGEYVHNKLGEWQVICTYQ